MQWVVSTTINHTSKSLWSSSAHSSQSAWPQTVACRGKAFPFCTNGLPINFHTLYLPSGWCSWTCASAAMLLEGKHGQYHPIQLQVLNSKGSSCLIPDRTAGQAAVLFRLTSGCGSMEGLFRAGSKWENLWHCGKTGCRNPEQGDLQRFSAGARLLPKKWACKGNERD